MINIVFIVPYESMKMTVEEIFHEHPERSIIRPSILLKSVDEIDDEDVKHADIVIARGYSANRIKKLNIPVIDITVTGFDITVAINTCLQRYHPKKIAVVGPLNTVYGIEEIQDIFPCKIISYLVDNPDNLSEVLKQLTTKGVDAVIAGKTGTSICQKLGINNTMIRSGRKTIMQAIDEAVRTVKLMRQERERTERFKTIMDYSFEGILSINKEGFISTANQYAKNVLGSLCRDLSQAHIGELLPQINVKKIFSGKSKILGELVKIRKNYYTINCVPSGDSEAVITFSNISKIQELEGQIRFKLHKKGLVAKYTFKDIIGSDRKILETIQTAEKFSQVDSNIFIFGESGTGKELFAQSIHNNSARREQPFVAINCAAIPENLLESELFGYVDGAFTGAAKGGKIGLFELAHKGTVFLDEIGDISPKLQSRLLRVLQEREIMRIGGDRVIPIDIRIISASNKNLQELVEKGLFREDLFYRLNVLKLNLPPLRERPNDIIDLCYYFIKLNREKIGSKLFKLTPEGEQLIINYSWPGNVRELSNFCERLCVLSEESVADIYDVMKCLEEKIQIDVSKSNEQKLKATVLTSERETIVQVLETSKSRREAAEKLGINPSTLWRKMKKYKLI